MEIIPFVGISLLITHMTWILLMQVQEIISSFGLEFTFISGFGTLELCIYGSWSNYLITVRKYWSLTFWPSHGYKIVQILTLLTDISLRWGVVCPLPDNITTWFFHRIFLPAIIYLSMILVTIFLSVLYRPLHILQIHRSLIWQMSMWLVLWEICWRQCN